MFCFFVSDVFKENTLLCKEPFVVKDRPESSGHSITIVFSENQENLYSKKSAARNSNPDNLSEKQAIADTTNMENPGSQSQSSNLPRKKCFQCTICKALFSQSWNCVSHMQSHIRVKPSLMCPSCGKLCSKKSELNIHVRIHTGEKPFVCKECKASFVRRGHLKEHMRRHTGQKWCFVC